MERPAKAEGWVTLSGDHMAGVRRTDNKHEVLGGQKRWIMQPGEQDFMMSLWLPAVKETPVCSHSC